MKNAVLMFTPPDGTVVRISDAHFQEVFRSNPEDRNMMTNRVELSPGIYELKIMLPNGHILAETLFLLNPPENEAGRLAESV